MCAKLTVSLNSDLSVDPKRVRSENSLHNCTGAPPLVGRAQPPREGDEWRGRGQSVRWRPLLHLHLSREQWQPPGPTRAPTPHVYNAYRFQVKEEERIRRFSWFARGRRDVKGGVRDGVTRCGKLANAFTGWWSVARHQQKWPTWSFAFISYLERHGLLF